MYIHFLSRVLLDLRAHPKGYRVIDRDHAIDDAEIRGHDVDHSVSRVGVVRVLMDQEAEEERLSESDHCDQ